MSRSRLGNFQYNINSPLQAEDYRRAVEAAARLAVREVLEHAMQAELEAFLQAAPYERGEKRRGYRNGVHRRNLVTPLGVVEGLRIPRDRAGQYKTQILGRYQRCQAPLTQAFVRMFIRGVSQGDVGEVLEPLLGYAPSASTISRLTQDLQTEWHKWRQRPLSAAYAVVHLDGVYFPIQYEHRVEETPVLVALGITPEGHKEVLGFQVVGAESAAGWQSLIDDLKQRGMQQVGVFVLDGDEGLNGVLARAFPTTPCQRCITHKLRNVLAHIPRRHKKPVAAAVKGIFAQPSRELAQDHLRAFCLRFAADYPQAVATLERDIELCLTFYDFPADWWRVIRTNNALEGLFSSLRRRTNKIGAFRNEQSCGLLLYAVLQTVQLRKVKLSPWRFLHKT